MNSRLSVWSSDSAIISLVPLEGHTDFLELWFLICLMDLIFIFDYIYFFIHIKYFSHRFEGSIKWVDIYRYSEQIIMCDINKNTLLEIITKESF